MAAERRHCAGRLLEELRTEGVLAVALAAWSSFCAARRATRALLAKVRCPALRFPARKHGARPRAEHVTAHPVPWAALRPAAGVLLPGRPSRLGRAFMAVRSCLLIVCGIMYDNV